MVIAIDGRAYGWAGVGRYVRHLISGLARIDQDNQYIVLVGREDLASYRGNMIIQRARNFSVRVVDSSYYSWREQFVFWQQATRVPADLWHFPNFNVPVLFSRPYVVTVHDITRFIFPGQKTQSLIKQVAYEQVFRRAVEKAAGVIFVSRATKHDLKELPVKIPALNRVVLEGVDSRCQRRVRACDRAEVSARLGQRRYLLNVGVWMNHKNLRRLLEAFAQVAPRQREVDLVLTGQAQPGYVDVKELANSYRIEPDRIKLVGQVEERLLPALYAEAEMLVFPSLYEGFGLPAIEAAAGGTPVITANVTSLPEIMGKAAAYVNPEYTPDIVKTIERILADGEYRHRLIKRGRQRAAKFSWENCARETLEFYGQVARSVT